MCWGLSHIYSRRKNLLTKWSFWLDVASHQYFNAAVFTTSCYFLFILSHPTSLKNSDVIITKMASSLQTKTSSLLVLVSFLSCPIPPPLKMQMQYSLQWHPACTEMVSKHQGRLPQSTVNITLVASCHKYTKAVSNEG